MKPPRHTPEAIFWLPLTPAEHACLWVVMGAALSRAMNELNDANAKIFLGQWLGLAKKLETHGGPVAKPKPARKRK